MIRLLLLIVLSHWGISTATLTENGGFSCRMKHSMRMNRAIHGHPQKTVPPFEFFFLDEKGKETQYYEPGKTYTVRLVGFIHYRGLLLQSRLASESGYLLGSLKGGRFLEKSDWNTYSVRLQVCDKKSKDADSVTHSNDSRKFITQVHWTSDNDVGAVQFMITIAVEDEIYWERWRPRAGFILPISLRGKTINIPNEVFIDEKKAFRSSEGKRRNGIASESRDAKGFHEESLPMSIEELVKLERRNLYEALNNRYIDFYNRLVLAEEKKNNQHNERRSLINLQKALERGELEVDIDKWKNIENSNDFDAQNKHKGSTDSANYGSNSRPISQAVPTSHFGSPPIEVDELKSSALYHSPSLKDSERCSNHQCKNYVRCINVWDGYECICKPGWMGKNCDRPCRDIYGTCNYWKRHGQCELQRDATDFFDSNCARSCGKCVYDNATVGDWIPIPAALLPLARMLGVWETNVNGDNNFTLDYPISFNGEGYTEILTLAVGTPLTFGSPVINFTSEATSKTNAENKHIMKGFMTLRDQLTNHRHATLITTSNFGLIMIEDGTIKSSTMYLAPRYRFSHPSIMDKLPDEMSRSFTNVGDRLIQVISLVNKQGRRQRLTKTYRKIKQIDYL